MYVRDWLCADIIVCLPHCACLEVTVSFAFRSLQFIAKTRKMAGAVQWLLQDDAKLHKLCHDGNLKKIKAYVEKLDDDVLRDMLASRKGTFGYTPLHEAVANGKANVLDYLLSRTQNAHINCLARSGFTPLHFATSSGSISCVRTLLQHSADVSIVDEYGKTARQIAELSSRADIVRLLLSEGEGSGHPRP